jgi:prepilin-type N-terminal cleavage/methylation domain-containing protein
MNRKAFTLIELLIVVAIIAILAAIAVPNFLEAQVRAKVSRQLSNMRTVVTAIELYAVDNNVIPLTTANGPGAGSPVTGVWGPNPNGTWTLEETWKMFPGFPDSAAGLTSPIAYITSTAALEDIFRFAHNFDTDLARQIMYLPSNWYGDSTRRLQERRYGAWVVRSAGPDTFYQNTATMRGDYDLGGWNLASYDPTNGSVSAGDIYRSQKRPQEDHT